MIHFNRKPVVALSDDQLRRYAPSVFATQPFHTRSDRYRFIPTIDIVNTLRSNNFFPVRVKQSRTRIEGKSDFTKHLLHFRQADKLGDQMNVGDEVAELILMNSHDGTSCYNFASGVFRLVCTNGLIVASQDYGNFKVRHSGGTDFKSQVLDATYTIMEDTPKVMGQIEHWKSVQLAPAEQTAFAEAVIEVVDNENLKPNQLLSPVRAVDIAKDGTRDLWTTMNVVQEHVVKGGVATRTKTGRRSTTKPIAEVGREVKLNKAIWTLTEKMAALKG